MEPSSGLITDSVVDVLCVSSQKLVRTLRQSRGFLDVAVCATTAQIQTRPGLGPTPKPVVKHGTCQHMALAPLEVSLHLGFSCRAQKQRALNGAKNVAAPQLVEDSVPERRVVVEPAQASGK